MERNKADLGSDQVNSLPLVEAFHALEQRRIDIDRRLTQAIPLGSAAYKIWIELSEILEGMRKTVHDLAAAPAANLMELRAKSRILAMLLRSEIGDRGQLIADGERIALALSITDDVTTLLHG